MPVLTRVLACGAVALWAVSSATVAWAIGIQFDYSLDTNNFFNTQAKRDRLQAAADFLTSRMQDDLLAIIPSGGNSWDAIFYHPGTGNEVSDHNRAIPADLLVVYAGGRNLGTGTLGQGGPGGFSSSGFGNWNSVVGSRGEGITDGPNATDFGPWGGSITFTNNAGVNWSFSADGPAPGQYDFYSVAMHELGHLLGFGTSDSFDKLISGNSFTGEKSTAEYDGAGNPPLDAAHAHWVNGTTDGGKETALDPSIATGLRKSFTELDFAALDDLGWSISPLAALPGDVNHDGQVDIFDVNVVSDNWGTSGPLGDANGDNTVDIFDVNVISDNWTGSGGAAAVPEPATLGLLIACGAGLLFAKRLL